jgi:hypothetical protein
LSKLFKLRDWLTVPEAAVLLSSVMSEPVTEADILRLVIDGHLQISVLIANPVHAVRNVLISEEEAVNLSWEHWENPEQNPAFLWMDGRSAVPDRRFFFVLRGVYDFPVFGAQKQLLEHRYYQLIEGPQIECRDPVRILLAMNEPGSALGLKEARSSLEPQVEKEHLAVGDERAVVCLVEMATRENRLVPELPVGTPFVIRTDELAKFCKSLEVQKEAPLSSKEKSNYLHLIGALLQLYWEAMHPDKKYDDDFVQADIIALLVKQYEGFPGMGERNLAEKLPLARASLRR